MNIYIFRCLVLSISRSKGFDGAVGQTGPCGKYAMVLGNMGHYEYSTALSVRDYSRCAGHPRATHIVLQPCCGSFEAYLSVLKRVHRVLISVGRCMRLAAHGPAGPCTVIFYGVRRGIAANTQPACPECKSDSIHAGSQQHVIAAPHSSILKCS